MVFHFIFLTWPKYHHAQNRHSANWQFSFDTQFRCINISRVICFRSCKPIVLSKTVFRAIYSYNQYQITIRWQRYTIGWALLWSLINVFLTFMRSIRSVIYINCWWWPICGIHISDYGMIEIKFKKNILTCVLFFFFRSWILYIFT